MPDKEITLNSICVKLDYMKDTEEEHHELVLGRLDKINNKIEDHEERLQETEKQDAIAEYKSREHKRTMRMVGGVIVGTITLLLGMFSYLNLVLK